jgi:hypothetical protein
MNEITIITPPDLLHNDVFRLLVIFPNEVFKKDLHDILTSMDISLNVFLYENSFEPNLEWLLALVKSSDAIVIDIDNCDALTKVFVSHIIAQPKTFYLTADNFTPYNLLSKNRIYDLSWLQNIFDRGNNEQA